jgi:hypothetical protein
VQVTKSAAHIIKVGAVSTRNAFARAVAVLEEG